MFRTLSYGSTRWVPALLTLVAWMFASCLHATQVATPGSSAPAIASSAADRSVVQLGQVAVSAIAEADSRWQTITLHRHGAEGNAIAVTLGIPFPPHMLRDARRVLILDEEGQTIPAHVEPTLHWYINGGGIRSVKVQFRTTLDGNTRTLHFAVGDPDGKTADGWAYTDGLIKDADGVLVPAVLATLSPEWMSTSLIAGPQRPAVPKSAYDRYFATQFRWAEALSRENGAAWLFDRPTTLFQQYVRTGRVDYLAAATQSYRFYMEHIRRHGAPGWPLCGGGWSLGEVNVCDPKYVYIEPILLALGLTGDDSEHDADLIQRMMGAWDTGGWSIPVGPYLKPDQLFTERQAGLGLIAAVNAYEITGEKRYLDGIKNRLGWLYQHQQHNPDGLGVDGSWRNSWQVHEGNDHDPATDIRGSSPWMTENIIDGLWHAWLATGDKRIPVMITAFGRYMERYGWIDPKVMKEAGVDWRNPCSGPNGQISWYWSSAHATTQQLIAVQSSEGWYSDSHNVEMTLPVAAARYFETDPEQQKALDRRLKLLSSSYNLDCADGRATPRRFNWNNRGVGVVQWFMEQFGSGAD